jgi:hypothetical protein
MSQYVGNELGIRPVQPEGISLRDWFAGQALAGMFAENAHPESRTIVVAEFPKMARWSYEMADAMLAARTPK